MRMYSSIFISANVEDTCDNWAERHDQEVFMILFPCVGDDDFSLVEMILANNG